MSPVLKSTDSAVGEVIPLETIVVWLVPSNNARTIFVTLIWRHDQYTYLQHARRSSCKQLWTASSASASTTSASQTSRYRNLPFTGLLTYILLTQSHKTTLSIFTQPKIETETRVSVGGGGFTSSPDKKSISSIHRSRAITANEFWHKNPTYIGYKFR